MAEWVIRFIEAHGYVGIAALMLLENLFPPFPSELIMPFAGFQAARGSLQWPLVILAGAVGALVGALPWYFAGRFLGMQRVSRFADRHGRWLTLSRRDLERAEGWFARHGALALVIGRLVPAVRTVISLPAGVCGMPLGRFCAWTFAGSALWCSVLTAAGYLLEAQYERISGVLQPVSTGILVVIVAWYVARVVRFRPERRESAAGGE
ncbi:DedA family protein [Ramlibacter sp. USB13]|uniref:DedA family protein n=1 Tax=Ramlibacter cellulosilyticus TaxID=2764187 RepID=A0A923MP08_9BURK|nr:DedA family protein [Ramlibacter cellulosilyticus]MBC5782565.1 DedA family protein [Ramlibacter cellulosilyticus]